MKYYRVTMQGAGGSRQVLMLQSAGGQRSRIPFKRGQADGPLAESKVLALSEEQAAAIGDTGRFDVEPTDAPKKAPGPLSKGARERKKTTKKEAPVTAAKEKTDG